MRSPDCNLLYKLPESRGGSFDANEIIKYPFTRKPSQPLIKIVIIYIRTHKT
jgi:hypothetical protein